MDMRPIPIDTVVKTTLFPFLMAEGAWARWRAGELPEPPGPRNGVSGSGAGLSLLLVGDSSAAGVGAPSQDAALMGQLIEELKDDYRLRWRVEAKSGATTASTLASLERVAPERFDVVVVALGVNDITRGLNLTRLLRRRARLYALLKTRFRAKRIIASGLPPVGNFPLLPQPLRWTLGRQTQRFDAALHEQARDLGVDYMPFTIPYRRELMASDGFHAAPE
ncbi:MAG TPA: SGNH/GDSL hydrolase family protein, partial [Aliiroseovarius sp.]|nr:SGNH/GDSL hydrolase family protein [Aliiroseovarius sp.]